jgi:hypothetical protein
MSEEEQQTLGLYLVIITLLVFMVSLAAITKHPDWFNAPTAAASED